MKTKRQLKAIVKSSCEKCGQTTCKKSTAIEQAIRNQKPYEMTTNGTSWQTMKFTKVSKNAGWYQFLKFLIDKIDDADCYNVKTKKAFFDKASTELNRKITHLHHYEPLQHAGLVAENDDRLPSVTPLGIRLYHEIESIAK